MSDGHLSPIALAFRAVHALIALVFLSAIGYIWWCAVTRRRTPLLRLAIGSLTVEGAVVAMNHGDCPLGPLQDRVGDPIPLFELVLSPRAAKRAVPLLGLVTLAGVAAVFGRPPAAALHPPAGNSAEIP